ncbi:unnamed protein product [Caenorhabditis brenneri]
MSQPDRDYPQRDNLMTFDNSCPEWFDVELVADGQSFYVIKGVLAKHSVDENTVESIAKMTEKWNTLIAMVRCEEFLMEEPREKMKKCFDIAVKYKMDKLKTKLINDIQTTDELLIIAPTDHETLDAKTLFELLQKSMSLFRNPNLPPPTGRIWTDDQVRHFLEQQYQHFYNFISSLNTAHQQYIMSVNQASDQFFYGLQNGMPFNREGQQNQNPFVVAAPRPEPEVPIPSPVIRFGELWLQEQERLQQHQP